MPNRLLTFMITFLFFVFLSFTLRAEVILDKGNGSFADAPTGFWKDVGNPPGWLSSTKNPYLYTAGTKFIQVPFGVTVSYMTGKKVTTGTCYKIEADLGGKDEPSVYVALMATENSDGTGKSVELVRAARNVEGSNTYTLVASSANSERTKDAVAGYYLRVELGIAKGRMGYFKNISVTSDYPETKSTVERVVIDPAALSIDCPDRKPVLNPDGKITCGVKSIWQKVMGPPYRHLTLFLNSEDFCTGGEMFDFGMGAINPIFFILPSRKETITGDSTVYTADVRAGSSSDKKLGTYKMSLTYLKNGLVKVETVCVLDDPSVLKNRRYTLTIPPYLSPSGEYVKDGKTTVFDAKTQITFSKDDLKDLKIVFFPKTETARFTVRPDQCSRIILANGNLSFDANEKGIMSFLIDISGGNAGSDIESAPNGINLWTADRLHFPDYQASPNLVQNPSFESGLRYWSYRTFADGAMPLKYTSIYELDNTVAHSGQNSLRIRALAINNTLPLGNYPIPYIPGQKYTLSFYAKSSMDKGVTLTIGGRGGQKPQQTFTSPPKFELGKEWQRYSLSFDAVDNFISFYFAVKLDGTAPDEEVYAWVDDVQIERGEMTDFKQAPYAMQLTSAARGNFLEYGKRPDFKLAIQSRPDAAGTVSISVDDFFFRNVLQKDFKFKADTSGKAVIALSDLDNKVFAEKLRGVFTVSSTLKLEGDDRPYKDYFRFSVMNFLENKHKNKNIFNINFVYMPHAGGPDFERFLAHERAIGIGSVHGGFIAWGSHIDYDREAERIRLMGRYGIDQLGEVVMNFYSKDSQIYDAKDNLKMTGIKTMLNPTAEQLNEFERICEAKAKNRPWFNLWWFTAESNPGFDPLQSNPDAFAKFLIATLRGIKKGNPKAKVMIEGGPWTIASDTGLKWTERYIKDVKRIDPTAKFDAAGGHFYCNIPESYDLDANLDEYIKMLNRNGCEDWPLYLGEGGNYSPVYIPGLGISPYIAHSLNSWYISPLTYHMGRAERISAAYSARDWLVGLKYQDRVKCMNDFATPGRYQDIDFSPRAFDKIPNTLGRILGDASFFKDIRFAPFCRCYVFKDDKTGAPIAAIWGHKESVDRWKEEPPVYQFDFKKQEVKFIDLMENEVSFPKNSGGNTLIPMSPFPLFIKGAPGAEQKMCDAIAAAIPATGPAGGVEVSAFPNAEGSASVIFTSKVSREYTGDAKVVINGAEKKWPLKIQPLGTREESIPLASALEYGKIRKFSAEYTFSGGNSGKISGNYLMLNSHAGITGDRDLSDWKGLPVIDLGAGVSMSVGAVDKKIKIKIRAAGKNLSAEDVFSGTGLYIDPFEKNDTWTEPKIAGGLAGDLGVYEIQKSKNGGMEALCRFSQGVLAGMDKDLMIVGKVQKLIKVKTATAGDAVFMEIEVPEKIFAPLALVPGNRFGLNISVPVKDGSIATLAPISGTGAAEPGKINFVMAVLVK